MPRAGLAGQVLLRGLQEVQVCANDREGRRRTRRESAMLFIVSKECMCICACTALLGVKERRVGTDDQGLTGSEKKVIEKERNLNTSFDCQETGLAGGVLQCQDYHHQPRD